MKQLILSAIGDGNGNTSSMRLTMIVTVIALLLTKAYNAWLTKQPIVWTADDISMLGIVTAGKVIQNQQENTTTTAITKTN